MPRPTIPASGSASGTTGAVVVPIRSFTGPKTRLADTLDPTGRERLARDLAHGVVRALAGRPVAVVSDDPDVVAWAGELGVRALQPRVRGLNPSVTAAVAELAAEGVRRVAVVHADLAHPGRLGEVLADALGDGPDPVGTGHPPTVVAVPDRHEDGTNVLVVPSAGFTFHYGPGSFAAHRQETERLGWRFEVCAVPELGWDVDTADDLAVARRMGRPDRAERT